MGVPIFLPPTLPPPKTKGERIALYVLAAIQAGGGLVLLVGSIYLLIRDCGR